MTGAGVVTVWDWFHGCHWNASWSIIVLSTLPPPYAENICLSRPPLLSSIFPQPSSLFHLYTLRASSSLALLLLSLEDPPLSAFEENNFFISRPSSSSSSSSSSYHDKSSNINKDATWSWWGRSSNKLILLLYNIDELRSTSTNDLDTKLVNEGIPKKEWRKGGGLRLGSIWTGKYLGIFVFVVFYLVSCVVSTTRIMKWKTFLVAFQDRVEMRFYWL